MKYNQEVFRYFGSLFFDEFVWGTIFACTCPLISFPFSVNKGGQYYPVNYWVIHIVITCTWHVVTACVLYISSCIEGYCLFVLNHTHSYIHLYMLNNSRCKLVGNMCIIIIIVPISSVIIIIITVIITIIIFIRVTKAVSIITTLYYMLLC